MALHVRTYSFRNVQFLQIAEEDQRLMALCDKFLKKKQNLQAKNSSRTTNKLSKKQ